MINNIASRKHAYLSVTQNNEINNAIERFSIKCLKTKTKVITLSSYNGHRNPCNSFLMVNMASGMDRWRVRPTTTTRNIAAILQLTPADTKSCSLGLQRISLILDIHVMLIDTCQNKVSADQYHVTVLRAQV